MARLMPPALETRPSVPSRYSRSSLKQQLIDEVRKHPIMSRSRLQQLWISMLACLMFAPNTGRERFQRGGDGGLPSLMTPRRHQGLGRRTLPSVIDRVGRLLRPLRWRPRTPTDAHGRPPLHLCASSVDSPSVFSPFLVVSPPFAPFFFCVHGQHTPESLQPSSAGFRLFAFSLPTHYHHGNGSVVQLVPREPLVPAHTHARAQARANTHVFLTRFLFAV